MLTPQAKAKRPVAELEPGRSYLLIERNHPGRRLPVMPSIDAPSYARHIKNKEARLRALAESIVYLQPGDTLVVKGTARRAFRGRSETWYEVTASSGGMGMCHGYLNPDTLVGWTLDPPARVNADV